MGLVAVVIPRRARPFIQTPSGDEVVEAVRLLEGGQAISSDAGPFDERRDAQTEAWRWRHAIAEGAGIGAERLKSGTFNDGDRWRFAIYLV